MLDVLCQFYFDIRYFNDIDLFTFFIFNEIIFVLYNSYYNFEGVIFRIISVFVIKVSCVDSCVCKY